MTPGENKRWIVETTSAAIKDLKKLEKSGKKVAEEAVRRVKRLRKTNPEWFT